jgi:uncharacterized membrane protein
MKGMIPSPALNRPEDTMVERTTTFSSATEAVSIDAPADRVFEFLAAPENLPRWAVGFARAIRPAANGNRWIVTTGQGEVEVHYVTDRALGVIDFHISPAPGVEAVAFSRVVPNGGGAEYVFTQFQTPGMSDDVFERQVHTLVKELQILRELIAAQAGCPS